VVYFDCIENCFLAHTQHLASSQCAKTACWSTAVHDTKGISHAAVTHAFILQVQILRLTHCIVYSGDHCARAVVLDVHVSLPKLLSEALELRQACWSPL